MAHIHGVYDTDQHFSIDKYTRNIVNTSDISKVIKQGDHNSERFSFDMPRYIDKHDMSLCNSVNIHYINTNGKEVSKSVYEVDDLIIDAKDSNQVVFTWLISGEATRYAGSLSFAISFECVTGGVVDYSWSAGINSDTVIGENINNGEVVISQYTDILAQWKQELVDSGVEGVNVVEKALSNALAIFNASIEAKGAAVLATIPDEYTDLSNKANHTYRNAAPVIKQTAEGELITVTDSAEMPVQGLSVCGKSAQVATTGAQLFDASGMITKNVGGATVTKNLDDSFTITGSGSVTSTFNHTYNLTHEETVALIKSGTIKLKCEKVTLPYFIVRLNVQDSTVMSVYNQYNAESEAEILQEWLDDETSYLRYTFYGPLDSAIVPGTIKPMLYQDGDGTWEPFTKGKPSPSPDYPQEIKSVGDNGTVTTKIVGKNLLEEDKIVETTTAYGLTCDYEGDGIFHIYGTWVPDTVSAHYVSTDLTMAVDPDKDYTYSAQVLEGSIPESFYPYLGLASDRIAHLNWNPIKLGPDTPVGTIVTSTMKPKTHLADANRLSRFWIFAHNPDYTTYTCDFRIRVWLEEGTESTPYKPYDGCEIIANTENGVRGIPVETSGNYADSNGQQWICDEIDFERGVYIQRIKTMALTPTFVVNADTNEMWIQVSNEDRAPANKNERFCSCTHFPGVSRQDSYNNALKPTYRGISINDRYIRVVDNEKFNSDSSLLNAWISEQNNNGVSVMFSYVLNTPIETSLTDEELIAYKELYTNYPVTTVVNDSGAHMKLTYAADTKTYIDNKFAELSALISNNA